MITGLDHVGIAVEDLDAAVELYARLLGGCVAQRHAGAALFALRNARILLLQADKLGQAPGLDALGLLTSDVSVTSLQLSAAGVSVHTSSDHPACLPVANGHAVELAQLDTDRTRGLSVRLVERRPATLPAADSFAADQVEALDHVVIRSAQPDDAVALYGGALGIRLALDRELAGTRMLFFRTGGVTIEVIADPRASAADAFYGLAYRVRDLAAAHQRLTAAGFAPTEPRAGRKPGTQVFSVRADTCGVPTLFIRDASRD
jgi:catechol 2,3-dioxygenase-like lactoylglutathione lyase family enzyme